MRNRDKSIDILRGFATFIVVIGHVFQMFEDYETTYLFKIIFSIQMPLFIAISGYSTFFSRKIKNKSELLMHIRKKTVQILVPWFVWSILVYIFKADMPIIDYIHFVAYHMESAYWFLFSLWCINIIHTLSYYVSNILLNKICNKILTIVIHVFFLSIVLFIGMKLGITFLGIKYTLYYYVFFIFGEKIAHFYNGHSSFNKNVNTIISAISFLIYFFLSSKYNTYLMEDSFFNILLRLIISATGCVYLFYLAKSINVSYKSIILDYLDSLGKYSLEIYVIQIFTLKIVPITNISISSIEGYIMIVFDSFIVMFFSILLLKLINANKLLRKILFYK